MKLASSANNNGHLSFQSVVGKIIFVIFVTFLYAGGFSQIDTIADDIYVNNWSLGIGITAPDAQ